MPSSFLSLAAASEASAEQVVKKSRFIGYAVRADTEAQARAALEDQRQHYPDARHHCSAFTYLPPGWENGVQAVRRSSDDGEPSGTAGRPILNVLTGSGLENVCLVVTRYFGGIKLGTGGLVSAYTETAAAALSRAKRVRIANLPVVAFSVPPSQAARLEAWMRTRRLQPQLNWADVVTFRLPLDGVTRTEIESGVASQLGSPVLLEVIGTQPTETPLEATDL